MNDSKDGHFSENVGKYLNLGLQLAVASGIGLAFGWWLDTKIGTLPLFLLVGLFVGAVAGFLNIYRAAYPPKNEEGRH